MKYHFSVFIFSISVLIGGPFILGVPTHNLVRAETALSNLNEQESFALPLAIGWNQISLPLQPTTSDIGQILASIEGNYELLYAYDGCQGDTWLKYDPNAPFFANTLKEVNPTMGLWIKMTKADTLLIHGTQPEQTLIQLCQGWNLIGYLGENGSSRKILQPIARANPLLHTYHADAGDSSWLHFNWHVPAFANTLIEMRAGLGYWLKTDEDITLLINPTSAQPANLIGVEVNKTSGLQLANQAHEAAISWVRYNGIAWHEVEPTQGIRNWQALQTAEENLQALIAKGLTPMVIVRGTPEWAQKVTGAFCGPIREEALDDFALFMEELVRRYSKPPFNIKYWEIGNEPDIDPTLIHPMEPFGCWGDQEDEFYGGGYFTQMLKEIYPVIKAADPDAQVILGGFVLDCDPTVPPEGKTCHSSRFLEGVLRAGGGEAFDIAAYHTYSYWHPDIVDSDLLHPNWQHRGGLFLGKADFIREVMAQYNVNKPIMMSEGALLCYPTNKSCPNEALFDAQASYLPRLYARAWAAGLQAAIWYTLNGPGWRHGGLLDEAQAPRPAYHALSFMAHLLQSATYDRMLTNGTLEGHAFTDRSRVYHLYWSNDGLIHTIPLPPNTQAIYNRFGSPLPISKNISVGIEPIYIQISP